MSRIFDAPSNMQSEVLTSNEWYMKYVNDEIIDPDGWRYLYDPKDYWYNKRISYDEFNLRLNQSSIRPKNSTNDKRIPF